MIDLMKIFFSKNAQSISKINHEVLLLMKFLQTKAQVSNMNIKSCDLSYTVIKKRDEKEIVDDKYENDFCKFIDIILNHYIGRKKDKLLLR